MASLTFNIVKLNFTTPLHLGGKQANDYSRTEEMLHSDTLKAAVYAMSVVLYGPQQSNGLLNKFQISSAFPYYDNHFFFPKPMIKLPVETIAANKQSSQNKKLKKIRYLDKSVFEQIISGKQIKLEDYGLNKDYLWDNKKESFPEISMKQAQQKVAIPFETGAGSEKENSRDFASLPYELERIFFSEKAGLFFLIECMDEESKTMIKASLNLLGDNGIGTDRYVGNGLFNSVWDQLDIQVADHPNAMMAMGLYCPADNFLKREILEHSAYLLSSRSGYAAGSSDTSFRHFKKKSIYMFNEASVFHMTDKPEGKCVNLRPNKGISHPVLRDGRCLFIPIKQSENT